MCAKRNIVTRSVTSVAAETQQCMCCWAKCRCQQKKKCWVLPNNAFMVKLCRRQR